MTPELKLKVKMLNFWNKNNKLKPLAIILLLEVMTVLHQAGRLVMVN